jgi:predicted Zn-dependent protease
MSRKDILRAGRWAAMAALIPVSVVCGKTSLVAAQQPAQESLSPAEAELQAGITLTRHGRFAQAIPHFLAAQGHVSNEYALEFNLALCYVGENQADAAIQILSELRKRHETASVENLLAQAYAKKGYANDAFEALQKAAALAPKDEKLYLYVSEAFSKHRDFASSLQAMEAGLHKLPNSARLHYERGYLLGQLDETDAAKTEFERAKTLAPHSAIGYLAAAEGSLMTGNPSEAVARAREGIREGHSDYQLLAVLGEALLRTGTSPGQPGFAEAKEALEKSVSARTNYASSQISLGHVFLLQGNLEKAIEHLERGRRLDPQNPSVYPLLAAALRRRGHTEQAQEMLAILATLNQEKVREIRSAPGDSKAIPGGASGAGTDKKPK